MKDLFILFSILALYIASCTITYHLSYRAGYNQAVKDLPPTAVVYVECKDGVCTIIKDPVLK